MSDQKSYRAMTMMTCIYILSVKKKKTNLAVMVVQRGALICTVTSGQGLNMGFFPQQTRNLQKLHLCEL
jgi:hypothetical protein